MGTKKRRSGTEWMLEAVAGEERESQPRFPPAFVIGLRGALEAGLSCEELTALVVLFTGIYETSERMTGRALIDRAELLTGVMREDIDHLAVERLRKRRQAEKRKKEKKLVLTRQLLRERGKT